MDIRTIAYVVACVALVVFGAMVWVYGALLAGSYVGRRTGSTFLDLLTYMSLSVVPMLSAAILLLMHIASQYQIGG